MDERQMRSMPSRFETRDENGEMYIEGYFAVFNSTYELWRGATESIAEGAFSDTLGGDIRALIDHETRLVLGRNTNGTLELHEDSHGLWGRIKINPNDQDAVNLYERVKRGDVDQCSFGFRIDNQDFTENPDGSTHWTIKKVTLYEVSVVTFPAYTETSVMARKQEFAEICKRKTEAWKHSMHEKLKGATTNGTESTDAQKED